MHVFVFLERESQLLSNYQRYPQSCPAFSQAERHSCSDWNGRPQLLCTTLLNGEALRNEWNRRESLRRPCLPFMVSPTGGKDRRDYGKKMESELSRDPKLSSLTPSTPVPRPPIGQVPIPAKLIPSKGSEKFIGTETKMKKNTRFSNRKDEDLIKESQTWRMPGRTKCCYQEMFSGHCNEITQGLPWCDSLWTIRTGGEDENECLSVLEMKLKCKEQVQ